MGLFFTSLWLPGFGVRGGEAPFGLENGAMLVLFGWLGALEGSGIAWLANPLLIMAWITSVPAWITSLFPRALAACTAVLGVSFVFSAFAVIFAASFQLTTQITINSAGHTAPITHLYSGYWLWFSSMIVMLVGNSFQIIDLYVKWELRREMRGRNTHPNP